MVMAERAAKHVPVNDLRELVRLLKTMRDVDAIDQANRPARRAAAHGRMSTLDLRRLEVGDLVALLMTLLAVGAGNLVKGLASDAVSRAWRGSSSDHDKMLTVLRAVGAVGADDQTNRLAAGNWHTQLTGSWWSKS